VWNSVLRQSLSKNEHKMHFTSMSPSLVWETRLPMGSKGEAVWGPQTASPLDPIGRRVSQTFCAWSPKTSLNWAVLCEQTVQCSAWCRSGRTPVVDFESSSLAACPSQDWTTVLTVSVNSPRWSTSEDFQLTASRSLRSSTRSTCVHQRCKKTF